MKIEARDQLIRIANKLLDRIDGNIQLLIDHAKDKKRPKQTGQSNNGAQEQKARG